MPLRVRQPARIVRRDADGRAVGMQLGEHLHEGFAALRIQVAGRFVREQDGRPAGNRARDGDELLVAARQRTGALLRSRCQSDSRQRLVNPRLPRRAVDAAHRQRILDVLVHRQVGDQVEALKDEADVEIADPRPLRRRQSIGGPSIQPVAAARRRIEQRQQRQKRRLAAAGGPGNG
jgi:hypothetical protein